MIVHTLAESGPARTEGCGRVVVCDQLDQPIAVFVSVNGQVLMLNRGSRQFDEMVTLLGIGSRAVTVPVDLDLTGGR